VKMNSKGEFIVDGWNNFCRVFEMPVEYPTGFCFGGGKPVNFQMVDWFEPVSGLPQPAVSKKIWEDNVGEIETKIITIAELMEKLIPFLSDKSYVQAGRKYLVITNFDASFIFEGEQ